MGMLAQKLLSFFIVIVMSYKGKLRFIRLIPITQR